MDNLFDVRVLGRKPEYYDGLEQRLGFPVQDGNAMLIHASGTSFRQEFLQRVETLCKFDRSPKMKLEPEPDNPYDRYAVKVMVVTGFDDVTGSPVYNHVGFIPKGRCPYCTRSLSGALASAQICKDCDAEIGITSPVSAIKHVNKFVTEHFNKLIAGIDTVTRSGAGNLGLDLWIRMND